MSNGDENKGPDGQPTPGQAKREDYTWCKECGGYIFKPLIQTEEPFFAGEPTTSCPAGHALDNIDGAPAKEKA